MLVLGLMFVLWLVVVTLAAFFVALAASSFFLWLNRTFLVELLCWLFLDLWLLLLFTLLGDILHLLFVERLAIIVLRIAWIAWIIIDSLILGPISVFHSCAFSVDSAVAMQAFHMLQVVTVAHQMSLIFTLTLAI